MRICEVLGGDGLRSFVAVIRLKGISARMAIAADGLIQARALLGAVYGQRSILSIREVGKAVQEQSLKPVKPSTGVIRPIKPKSGIIKPIKPLTPKQGMKKSLADNKKVIKKKERKTKAIDRVRAAQNKLADINRKP